MIVKMKHLDLVCLERDREDTLERLRELGCVHLNLGATDGAAVVAAKDELERAAKAVRLIEKARGKTKRDDIDIHERSIADILELDDDRTVLKDEAARLEREIAYFEPWGDFDPELARKVQSAVDVELDLPDRLPEMRLSRMKEKLARVQNRTRIDDAKLAGSDELAIMKKFPGLHDRLAFAQASELLGAHGDLAVISGWVPERCCKALLAPVNDTADLFQQAKRPGWGVILRDPVAGEMPPTQIEPPRMFRSMQALFGGLGIAPAYDETDVSVPFMCYFSLFFAMLVGDGAYGAIFLALTLLFRAKLPRSWFVLMTVFSAATVVWGVLSNTWFGAGIPWCAEWPTVKWLADPSYHNMMLLCFTIGASHLMLARIWNGICKLPDSTAIAEFGWAGVLLFMYFVTNSIVGIFASIPVWAFVVFGVSLVAVFGFTVKPSELKCRGAELGMLPLNIMSALGDIISYVRLFAVGLASVKVAENFNNMAVNLLGMSDEWYVKALMAVAMVAIMVFGHLLNMVMAGLSILVHAVRLNTLEFSNHKGVSWAGYAYRAFARVQK